MGMLYFRHLQGGYKNHTISDVAEIDLSYMPTPPYFLVVDWGPPDHFSSPSVEFLGIHSLLTSVS